MNKTAIVVGATGLVGQSLVNQLLSDTSFDRVIVLARKKLHLTQEKLTQVEVDFTNLATAKSYFSAGTFVFCCLGTTMKKAGSKEAFYQVDYTFVANTANLAKEAGAAQFLVVTAAGAATDSMFYYSRVKGEIENYLKALNFNSLVILRPSMLLGDRQELRTGEQIGKVLMEGLDFLIPLKYKAIHVDLVARAMLRCANENPKGVHILESDDIWRKWK